MAAYCGCCGAEITQKTEACPVCGTPRHGMMPPDGVPDPPALEETTPPAHRNLSFSLSCQQGPAPSRINHS